jgi:tRNA(fMet)-specific endonuclease VapC
MVGNKYFLDSNVVIDLFRGNKKTLEFIQQDNFILVPVIVLGELLFGAENSLNPTKHYKQVNDFISDFEIINIDKETAKAYAEIKANLKKIGKPIPDNDIWIAALSIQHKLILVTNDGHFTNVDHLKIKQI